MNAPSIVPYERRYREDVLSLMFYSRHTHTHFDWYKPGQWLDLDGVNIMLAFEGTHLIGVLGVSEMLNGAAWVRLAAVAHDYDPGAVLAPLWEDLRVHLMRSGVQQVAVLAIHAWLQPFLPALGFQYVEDVVTMHRTTLPLPELQPHHIRLHTGYIEDLPDIVAIDHAAFAPPWQMSAYDLRMAQRESGSCTVAVFDHHAVGYELSTRHHYSGHLARLAVIPEMQGRGIGAILLHFLLGRLERRGMRGMTVNTQQSNLHSQHLYERFGFRRNGFDLPVWNCRLG
jgi:ribosomal protein S18 acetylase RimI-like enzyme